MARGVVIDFTANIAKFEKQVDKITGDLSKFESRAKSAGAGVEQAFSKLDKVIGTLGLARLASDVLDTNRAFESLRAQLASATGSTERAAVEFDKLKDFAATTPFQLDTLTESFLRLKSFGLEPTSGVMQALADQSAKLGGSSETLSGITLALGQAWAKGKLQGEEILQLIERGVPVWNLLEQATGKNAQQLQEMSSKGLITRDVISELITKMGELASGSSAAAMDTLNGKISNLSDSWERFKDTLLNSDSESLIKGIVENWVKWIDYFEERLSRGSGALGEIEKINDRIIAQREKIAAMNDQGYAGKAVDTVAGNRLPQEQIKLDNLKKEREAAIQKLSDERRAAADLRPDQKTDVAANRASELDKSEKLEGIDSKAIDKRNESLEKSEKITNANADAIKIRNQKLEEGARVYESTRTPIEQHNSNMQRNKELLDSGAISQDTYNRAASQSIDALEGQTKATEELSNQEKFRIDQQKESLKLQIEQSRIDSENPFLQAKLRNEGKTDDPRYNPEADTFNFNKDKQEPSVSGKEITKDPISEPLSQEKEQNPTITPKFNDEEVLDNLATLNQKMQEYLDSNPLTQTVNVEYKDKDGNNNNNSNIDTAALTGGTR